MSPIDEARLDAELERTSAKLIRGIERCRAIVTDCRSKLALEANALPEPPAIALKR